MLLKSSCKWRSPSSVLYNALVSSMRSGSTRRNQFSGSTTLSLCLCAKACHHSNNISRRTRYLTLLKHSLYWSRRSTSLCNPALLALVPMQWADVTTTTQCWQSPALDPRLVRVTHADVQLQHLYCTFPLDPLVLVRGPSCLSQFLVPYCARVTLFCQCCPAAQG